MRFMMVAGRSSLRKRFPRGDERLAAIAAIRGTEPVPTPDWPWQPAQPCAIIGVRISSACAAPIGATAPSTSASAPPRRACDKKDIDFPNSVEPIKLHRQINAGIKIHQQSFKYLFLHQFMCLWLASPLLESRAKRARREGAEPCSGEGCDDPDPSHAGCRGDAGEEGADIAAQCHARAGSQAGGPPIDRRRQRGGRPIRQPGRKRPASPAARKGAENERDVSSASSHRDPAGGAADRRGSGRSNRPRRRGQSMRR